jgi:hypothetical protein
LSAPLGLWHQAVNVRDQWLDHGLCTAPAQRAVAEETIAIIYAWNARRRPRFVWVDSPRQALPFLAGLPTHDGLRRWIGTRTPPGRPPLMSDIAAGLSRLRSALDAGADDPALGSTSRVDKKKKPWPVLPAPRALDVGVPLREVLRQGVRQTLRARLSFHLPIRAELGGADLPSAWYGQQEAPWIAYYDALRRLGLARYQRSDSAQLDVWAALARSTGWWWPTDDVCVAVDRPSTVDPFVEYRDGWRPRLS